MSSPLIEQLYERHGLARLNAANLDATLGQADTLALFFSGDPRIHPESNDLAVILPELLQAFPGRFQAVVVEPELQETLKARYALTAWPCLVFLRGGRYLGRLCKLRDWSEYLSELPVLLDRKPGPNPGLGLPVVAADEPRAKARPHG